MLSSVLSWVLWGDEKVTTWHKSNFAAMKAIAAPQHSWQTLEAHITQTATVKAMASSFQTLESFHSSISLPLISLLVVTEAETSIVGKRQGVSRSISEEAGSEGKTKE